MFEHIHFQTIHFSDPLRTTDSDRFYRQIPAETARQMAPFEEFYNAKTHQADFELKGEGRMLFPPPLGKFAKDHFLFLQVFGILNAADHFFTRRKNYDSWLLLFTYEGSGALEYGGKTYTLHPGEGFWIDCRKPHYYYTTDSHWLISTLHFNGCSCAYLHARFSADGSVLFTDRYPAQTYQHLLEQTLLTSQSASPIREFETSACLEQLLLFLLREKTDRQTPVPDYIAYLQRYIESNYTRPLTLEHLASFANISKYHLSREFKKYTGFSPNEYLIELRLDRAKFLLKNSSLPIGQVAAISGFSSYPNFLKLFKERTDMTPGGYRK